MVNDDGKSYSPIHNIYDISSPMDKKLDELINQSNLKQRDSKQSTEKKSKKTTLDDEESSSSEEEENKRNVSSRKRRWERNSQFKDSPAIKKKKMIEKPKQPFSDEEDDDGWTDNSDGKFICETFNVAAVIRSRLYFNVDYIKIFSFIITVS